MSHPTRPRVTIDDRITRLYKSHVSLEVVERVERDVFYTAGSPTTPLRHDGEDATWLRGHYVLDSKEVEAAYAAWALSDAPMPPAAPPEVDLERLRLTEAYMEEMRRRQQGAPARRPGTCPGIAPKPKTPGLWDLTRYKLGV